MVQFFQWVASVPEVLTVLGETPRAGALGYMWVNSEDPNEFFVVEKVRGAGTGIGYQRDDVKAFVVSKRQIRNFLTNRGETLPPEENLKIRVRPSTLGGLLNDEVVVVDSTQRITQL